MNTKRRIIRLLQCVVFAVAFNVGSQIAFAEKDTQTGKTKSP